MKSLCDLPSWGTFRTGPQWVIVFLTVAVFGPTVLVSLLVLAPILPVLARIDRKKPAWAWRTALWASLTVSVLLIVPVSPLFVEHHMLISIPDDPLGYQAQLAMPILLAIIAEIPLVPLIAAAAVHSMWSCRRDAGSTPMSGGHASHAGDGS